MVDQDFSFIRLRGTRNEAFNMSDSPFAEVLYNNQIQLQPFDLEPIVQITNAPDGVELENYTIFLVSCDSGREEDVSRSFFVQPFQDINGIAQIVFEIIDIRFDFGGEDCYFRFENASIPVYYSNKFRCTANQIDKTTRYDYKHNTNFAGVSYSRADFFQSIRLAVYYNDLVQRDELDQYYQITTNQNVNVRAKISDLSQYRGEAISIWIFRRLKRVLYSSFCYIDEVRSYPFDPPENGERFENSNIAEVNFLVDANENDTRTPVFQIYTGFRVVSFTPANNSTITLVQATALTEIVVTMNQGFDITGISGSITGPSGTLVINSGNATEDDVNLRINVTGYFTSVGVHNMIINAGSLTGGLFNEASPLITYQLTVQSADFLNTDFLNTDFLTN